MIVVCTIVEENTWLMWVGQVAASFSCPWQFGNEANGYDIQSISTSIRFIL